MTIFTVYIELFGKKMKVNIEADSKELAKEIIKERVVFHKIEVYDKSFNKANEIMDNIFDILNKKL